MACDSTVSKMIGLSKIIVKLQESGQQKPKDYPDNNNGDLHVALTRCKENSFGFEVPRNNVDY